MSRRVGLSNNAPGLLSIVGNRPRRAPNAPVADDDPPVSTDSEDDTATEGTLEASKASERAASPKRKTSFLPPLPPIGSDSDSSDYGTTQRGSIKPTRFTSTREKAEGEDEKFPTKRRKLSDSPERQTTRKLTPGTHLMDKWAFTAKKKSKATYGKRAQSSQSSQPDSSQGGRDSKRLRIPSSIESPQKKRSKLLVPGKNIPSSPGGSPMKSLSQLTGNADSDEDDSILAGLVSNRTSKTKPARKGKNRDASPSPIAERAVFKLPTDFLDSSANAAPFTGTPEDLSKLSSDEFSEDDKPTLQVPAEFEETPGAKCPWCGEEVDKQLLSDFSRGQRLHVRMQTRFCQLHKQQTAKQTWKDLGYPDIEWDTIETRFAPHCDFLLAIINGKGSHFRTIHAKNVKEGRARSMKEGDNMNPGYYGPRGFNAMCDYLVNEFGDTLKTCAVDDRVIAGRGSAAFIQAVLVPELGVRLIMEDMALSETKARQLMEESKGMGALAQPEADK